jgi:diguanylate cyclase (GGDEF)-like protein
VSTLAREISKPATALRVLIVEDSADDAELVAANLRRGGLAPEWQRVENAAALRGALAAREWDAVLSDFGLPGFDGLEALAIVRREGGDVPFLLLSDGASEETVVRALKDGAFTFIHKRHLGRLVPALEASLRDCDTRRRAREAQAALVASEARFRGLVESAPLAVLVHRAGRIAYANPRATALLAARGAGRLLGMPLASLLAPEVDGPERTCTRLDGVRFCAEVLATPIEYGGEPAELLFLADVSERKTQQARIAQLSRLHRMLSAVNATIVRVREPRALFAETCRIAVEHGGLAMAWIAMRDAASGDFMPAAHAGFDGGLTRPLPAGTAPGGPEAQGTAGRAIRDKRAVLCNDILADPGVGYTRRAAIERGYRSVIALPLLVNDTVEAVFVLYAAKADFFSDEEVRLFEEIANDLAFALDYQEKAARAEYLALYDPLTELPNRAWLLDHLAQQVRTRAGEESLVALVVADLDRFRRVNETLGRSAGDKLLRKVAARLQASAAGHGALARVGPDRFAFVLRGAARAADVLRAAQAVLEAAFGAPIPVHDEALHVAAHAGIALFPGDGANAGTLFHNAEAALVRAKENGERIKFHEPGINVRAAERLRLEGRLRRALAQGELALHYQPKACLADEAITGAEALLRWNDPEMGTISPASFVPVLEETGMIIEAGRWALRRALADAVAAGAKLPRVAVNVSAVQLERDDFVDDVAAALRETGAAPSRLELEVTESLMMRDLEAGIEKLARLRALGVRVALDDFGTGYSSLAYLRRLPLDTVKIDRAFVREVHASTRDAAIAAAIVGACQALGLRVVAEGVETPEQRTLLEAIGCDEIQGYLLGRPMPLEELLRWLEERG